MEEEGGGSERDEAFARPFCGYKSEDRRAHLVKMGTAPFCRVLASMTTSHTKGGREGKDEGGGVGQLGAREQKERKHFHSLKDSKVALPWYSSVVVYERVRVLHGPPASTVAILRDADSESRKLGRLGCHERVTVEGLQKAVRWREESKLHPLRARVAEEERGGKRKTHSSGIC